MKKGYMLCVCIAIMVLLIEGLFLVEMRRDRLEEPVVPTSGETTLPPETESVTETLTEPPMEPSTEPEPDPGSKV